MKWDANWIMALTVVSLPPRGAWIEIPLIASLSPKVTSLPPRGAWIEIASEAAEAFKYMVAPPTGSVD